MNVYEALAEAQNRIGAVGKNARADALPFRYRSIDALLGAVHPIFAELGLVISPRVLEHETEAFQWGKGKTAHRVRLVIEYRVMCKDGSYLPAELCPIVLAEGVDDSDKAPGKAHSYGLKIALGQLLSIPTEADNEARHWPEPEPIEHATPELIADVVTRFADLDDKQQAQLAGWLNDFGEGWTPTAPGLATAPAEIVQRLSASINRALQANGTEPFPIDDPATSEGTQQP